MTRSADVLIVAAEASGDALGAGLALALLRRAPGLQLSGLAGPGMRAAGVHGLFAAESLGVMGLTEVFAALPRLHQARRAMRSALERRPRVLVCVDSPDFNLPLARRARALGVPVVMLGSPQVWAWRAQRARSIAETVQEVLCLLPFEPAWYRRHGGRASFVGHPLADHPPAHGPPGQDWALLPGSRRQELRRLLPVMLDAVRSLRREHPGAVVRLPLAPGLDEADLEGLGDLSLVQRVGSVREAVTPARACLVAAGTATLELACLGRPMVVCCRVSPLTWQVGTHLVRGVRQLALPNLLADRPVVPEFNQHFSADQLAGAWMAAAEGGQLPELAAVRRRVSGPDSSARAAERVLRYLGRSAP